jgi:3-oxoacyl-[acyl-carrier protein] reductase
MTMQSMDSRLAGRTVLVTGAARGIGRRIAQYCAAQGATVCVADLDTRAADECAASLEGRASGIGLDVRDSAAVERAVGHIVDAHGSIDVLVNSAGLLAQGPFDAITAEAFEALMAVNVGGVFNCARAVVPHMKRRERGTIVNIASVSAMRGGGSVGNVWYGASKAAVIAITQGLARELGPFNVRVNAVAPALVETDMVRDALTPEVKARALTRFPLGRLATVDDVANAAIFLASDAAAFITGETLAVDGGFLKS